MPNLRSRLGEAHLGEALQAGAEDGQRRCVDAPRRGADLKEQVAPVEEFEQLRALVLLEQQAQQLFRDLIAAEADSKRLSAASAATAAASSEAAARKTSAATATASGRTPIASSWLRSSLLHSAG
eukprot:CAMPEP_0180097640 /NCGR_PEP_ID=MMETSP0985-20121206/27324_1 /TAXON_ID=483367 /ORGANISM="non described non described, Strain CCMP 2436" /LENGTH=124 /DNA_ID=CAMNT_0022033025 /DNA_START=151 /DNA_END=523 /DNA_ORIENTATION=+